jgi:DNA-binding winged helix-turn-helix (wHTH) protein/TolB-like protein/Tfp pilus assembly protein PilF
MTNPVDVSYAFGPYVLEPAEWRLQRGQEVVPLPPKAFALLHVLVANAGTLVTKSEILTAVWEGTFVEEGNVAFYVAMLRKVLSEPAGTTYIETVKTRGYRFAVPVEVRRRGSDAQDALPIAPAAPPDVAAGAGAARGWNRRVLWLSLALLAIAGAALAAFSLWRRFAPIDSVVVMPFRAIAPDSDQAYLESGLAEAIAMRLGNVPSLRVPPLAAVRRDEGPFEAGRRLGTQAVLTGTIQRAAERVLITTQLSRVSGGDRLWAWSFDTTAGDILSVQNDIAERITVRLRRDLTDADRARLTRRETVSGDAYDLFLQARERWRLRTPESVKQAIALYEKAIAIDPQFARAYAGLADCYNIASSGLPPNFRYPRAKAAAEKAVDLDPDSAEARTSLAFLRYKFEWRWQEADREFKEAIRLNPRYALAHHWYGEFLGLMDRPDEAIAELKRALELDPFSPAIRSDLTRPLLRARRIEEARQVLKEGLQIDPNWYGFPLMMADILALEGRDRESAEQTWRAMALRGVPEEEINELRAAFGRGGMAEMTRAQIRQLLQQDVRPTSSASFFTAQYLSFAYGRLGDREQALRWLEISIDRREDAAIHMLTNPAYDSIRREPRFVHLLERLNLKQFVKP